MASSSSTSSTASDASSASAPPLSAIEWPAISSTPARGRGTAPPATASALGAASSSALGVASSSSSSRPTARQPTSATGWGGKCRVPVPSGATFLKQSSSRTATFKRSVRDWNCGSSSTTAGYGGLESARSPNSSSSVIASTPPRPNPWASWNWNRTLAAATGALAAATSSASSNPSVSTTFAGLDTSAQFSSASSARPSSITPTAATGVQNCPAPPSSTSFAPSLVSSSSTSPPSLCNAFAWINDSGNLCEVWRGGVLGELASAGHGTGVAPQAFQATDRWFPTAGTVEGLRQEAAADFELRRELCWDCHIEVAVIPLTPCGHRALCWSCYVRRRKCPCCDTWIDWFPLPS